MSIASRVYVRLKDQNGVQVALFEDFEYLEINEKLNDVGSYALRFVGEDDVRYGLFELDGQLEFYRRVLGQTGIRAQWKQEWQAFHRKARRVTNPDGSRSFESTGVGYNDLLARSVVAYKEGTIRADKNAPAETVMKEYVDENCGPTADATVVGRLYQGGFPNFSVEVDGGNGIVWAGGRAYENVLDVLKEIADLSNIDFAVTPSGDATFEFRTYVNQLGSDRTNVGLNPSNGLNAAGNAPVVFAVDFGTVQSIEYELDRLSEANVAIVMGKGEGSTRTTVTRVNYTNLDDSPWNRREVARSSTSYDEDYETYSLNTFGDEILEEMKPKEVFVFKPIQTETLVYGLDYFLGDRVTALYRGIERNKKIVGVKVVFSSGVGESVELEFEDVPGV